MDNPIRGQSSGPEFSMRKRMSMISPLRLLQLECQPVFYGQEGSMGGYTHIVGVAAPGQDFLKRIP